MNWDAVGAISEVVGVIAIVITLIYLVRETRKNSESIDATSSREAFHQISERPSDSPYFSNIAK